MILYQGPSMLDGKPIVAIATDKTTNAKTGDVVQVWILRADIAPNVATKTGDDVSICGNCPHRHFLGGICYVLVFQAPLQVYKSFRRGSYRTGQPAADRGAYKQRRIRLGAYGDPAAVPVSVWREWFGDTLGVVGYTHQASHANFDPAITDFCMISADTPQQARRYHARGLATYRMLKPGQSELPGEAPCPSDTGIKCADCMRCDGKHGSFTIPAHGARASRLHLKVTA